MKTNLMSLINKFALMFVLVLGFSGEIFAAKFGDHPDLSKISSFRDYLNSLTNFTLDTPLMRVDSSYPQVRGNKPAGSSVKKDTYLLVDNAPGATLPANATTISCGKLSELTFVGFKFLSGGVLCTGGYDDKESSCPGMVEINPANPVYHSRNTANFGTETVNNNGYHYCIASNDRRSQKGGICDLAKIRYPHLEIVTGHVRNLDASCKCGAKGASGSDLNEDNCKPEALKALHEKALKNKCTDLANQNKSANIKDGDAIIGTQLVLSEFKNISSDILYPWEIEEKQLADPNEIKDRKGEEEFFCECKTNTTYAAAGAGNAFSACGDKIPDPLASASPSDLDANKGQGEDKDQATSDEKLKACLDTVQAIANKCEQLSLDAQRECKAGLKEAEGSLGKPSQLVGAVGNLAIMSQAGSGNQQGCFGASVALSGTKAVLAAEEKTCEGDVNTCRRECSEKVLEDRMDDCLALVNVKGQAPKPKTEADLDKLILNGAIEASTSDIYVLASKDIRNTYKRGLEICENDAGKSLLDMENVLQGLGHALQSSLICSCNYMNQSANCAAIPPIDTCGMNANDPSLTDVQLQQIAACRPIQDNLDICTPGAQGYNQQQCACMQNPGSCTVVSGGPAPDSFFGKGLNVLGQNPTTFAANMRAGGGANGIGAGSYDLSGGGPSENGIALNAGASSGYNPKVAGATGGGGGAGGGNGPIQDGKPGVAGDKNGLLSGLFGLAKVGAQSAFSAAKNLLNGSRVSTKDSKSKDPLSEAQKFRPKGSRNIASSNGPVARANLNIFDIIKLCATGSTCVSNSTEAAFIKEP